MNDSYKLNMSSDLLKEAIDSSAIIPPGQKRVLKTICSYSYPISAKEIEDELQISRPSTNFALQQLLKRNFIIRIKDSIFLYKENIERLEELKLRYIEKCAKK